MLRPEHIEAIETRLRWLRWGQSAGTRMLRQQHNFSMIAQTYEDILETADTYHMERHFAALVEAARLTAPDDLAFEATWMQSKRGWLWVQEPFLVPETEAAALARAGGEYESVPVLIRAIGWREIPEGEWLYPLNGPRYKAEAGCVQFCMYADGACFPELGKAARKLSAAGIDPKMIKPWDLPGPVEWWPWAYFVLKQGDRLSERIDQFERLGREENPGGAYVPVEGRIAHPLHEIRWLYAAVHIMAQKLAVIVRHTVDRHTRRRAERNQQVAPPIINVITLRKLEADRQRDPRGNDVDWAWSWIVSGHWRNQFYASENLYRQIFIEAFLKGPPDKPIKPPGHKLFVAKR